MGKPFFSVIVPAHNSGIILEKCLRSVKNQTFTDYELIVICDSCTDFIVSIAKEYADYWMRTEFGMDGLARNAGIDIARGQWIVFLDDDDWWMHEYVLEETHNAIQIRPDADMVLYDFLWKGRGYWRNLPSRMNIAVWSKAFRRELIGDIRFPAIPFTSDAPFMQEIIDKGPVVFPTNMLMYYYNYMRKGSQTEEHEHGGGD